MPQLLWDASSLAKHYAPEVGTHAVNAILSVSPALSMATTYVGYAETCSLLRRKLNQGAISISAFTTARRLLDMEVFYGAGFDLMSIDDTEVLAGIGLSDGHNINSTDAAILRVYLDYSRSLLPADPVCILVASDKRLLRAAATEGVRTLNPETVLAADIPGLLGAR